ncbi:MAG: nucleoside-diphosphate kinase [Spirochaetes bacterium GWC1_27_15]|nr:MAG: nucleoside-diphosphate kinase [Spirochaetes bacterium GWB1_27_13]OHD21294.1 MAG: nucleoside-diphosphate kinase [Spirochaetes bacterium GWC1_27_15]
MERTLVILKPDCLQRGISGEIISRFEKKGLKIVAMKLSLISKEKASYHYDEHKAKPFFGELVGFITSSPVILMVVEGDDAIKMARKLSGATKAIDAEPGTIRGDFVMHTGQNVVHTSDGPESAKREIENFFAKEEIIEYTRNIDQWI